jgi:protein phosphatase
VKLSGAVHTDRGRVRRENQDSYGFSAAAGLYLVADGMGGRAGGRQASTEAARVVTEAIAAGLPGVAGGAERLRSAIDLANRRVWDVAQADPALNGMGTTIAALLFEGETAHIAHVGDSRVYRIRDGAVVPLTRDHSYLAELAERGIEVDAAQRRAYGSTLTRALGVAPSVQVDVSTEQVAIGDTYIICSDGVHRLVDPADMQATIAASGGDLARACVAIVERANAGGGPDNSTIIVLHAGSDGAPDGTAGGGYDDETIIMPRPGPDGGQGGPS